jgi:hypothetical protein
MSKKKGTLKITSSIIVVSPNSYIESGYYFDHKVFGILPGCRKVQQLILHPMTGCLWVRPLFGHNGSACINPQVWADLIRKAPVRSSKTSPVALTPELVAKAIEDKLYTTTCPAVTNRENVHPDYQPTFDQLEVSVA